MFHVEHCPTCNGQKLQFLFSAKDYSISGEEFSILKCPSCDLLVTSPQPSEPDLPKYYDSETYVSHSETKVGIINQLYHFAKRINHHSKKRLINRYTRKGNLLDFGCGTGSFLKYMNNHGWTSFGVEPSDKARRTAGESVFRDISEINHHTFSLITLWHVLEHLPDPRNKLIALVSLLEKSGHLFIAVPNTDSIDFKHYGREWAALDVPRHLFHFNQKSILKLMEGMGMKLITIKPMLLDPIYVTMLTEKYKKGGSLKGIVKGFSFAIRELFNQRKSSSLIFIFQKI